MAMNRETKRMMQRQGQLGPDGESAAPSQEDRRRSAATRQPRERTSPGQFLREVRGELRKVAWPSREETIRLSGVVLFALVVLTALIFGLDYVFAKSVFFLFSQ
ncbi:MAG: preprotein translocase, SecE subunit [Ramlibacter sp.]|jgi:preprotein translocase subunit SecE|nr:preprotein translocase, SecE subunit [Ramlibacter sp.]